jgi:hypothetical protein
MMRGAVVRVFVGLVLGWTLAAAVGGSATGARAASSDDTVTCYPEEGKPFTCGPVSKGYHCCDRDTKCCH